MGFDKDFSPVLRFMVVSDVHYKNEHSAERERMEKALLLLLTKFVIYRNSPVNRQSVL